MHHSNRPGCGVGLILLLHFLAEPLTATEPIAALDGSFVLRCDCSDLLLEEGRDPQGHTVNLEENRKGESDKLRQKSKYMLNDLKLHSKICTQR